MAKLYAELTSDKGGRKVSKGGDNIMRIEITHKGVPLWDIEAGIIGLIKMELK